MKSWVVFALLCTIVDLSAASEKRQQVNSCPQPWSFYNGRCFHVERRQMNWTQAQDNCQSMGGNLTSIESIMEHQHIQMLIRNGTNNLPVSWVGATAGEETSVWRWIDGREVSYSDWCPGEPNNPNQGCLQINYSNQKCWDNDFCKFRKVSVCHAPATYVSSATLNRCVHQFIVLLGLFAIFLSDML
ncbi:type-2 ice-structuring protein-like isoform 1-T1 [Synchiropus picturatus]